MLPSLLLPPSSFHAALTTTLTVTLLSLCYLTSHVDGHGYMFEPPSRSYSAWQTGLDYGAEAGVPNRDYCAWCININDGVCGITQSGINYDAWLDSTGQPMPWQSQATYTAGDIITVSSILTAHHEGHLEVWACPNGRASTQDCFREHKLNFVDDVSFGMPPDPNYPLRGYFYGGWDYSDTVMTMRFQLPETLVGEEVLLQWWYFTANSCTPEGYADYMARNNLPDSFWSPDTITCTPEMYPDVFAGFEPYRVAERFLNCAEVTIQAKEVVSPSSAPVSPTPAPVAVVVDPTNAPSIATASPTFNTANSPVKNVSPTTDSNDDTQGEEGGCCSHDYKSCADWCNGTDRSPEQCETDPNCTGYSTYDMKWLRVGDNASCAARWEPCTEDVDMCCNGLLCHAFSQGYKQCLSPNDPR